MHALGTRDRRKLRSCLTLFAAAVAPDVGTDDDQVFGAALAQYYGGEPDPRTLELLVKA